MTARIWIDTPENKAARERWDAAYHALVALREALAECDTRDLDAAAAILDPDPEVAEWQASVNRAINEIRPITYNPAFDERSAEVSR